jgi:hypothetical protein
MSNIKMERMAGLIAGVFLVRSTESILSVVVSLAFSTGNFTSQITGAVAPFFGALLQAFLGWSYLREKRKKWLYVFTLVLLALSVCGAVIEIIMPFTIHMIVEAARPGIIASGITHLLIVVVLIGCVWQLMKSNGET